MTRTGLVVVGFVLLKANKVWRCRSNDARYMRLTLGMYVCTCILV